MSRFLLLDIWQPSIKETQRGGERGSYLLGEVGGDDGLTAHGASGGGSDGIKNKGVEIQAKFESKGKPDFSDLELALSWLALP